MSWLPEDFFLGHPAPPEQRPDRPIGQGDVFPGVPVAGKTAINNNGQPAAGAKIETVIIVDSSCGMRKGAAGNLSAVVAVAPVKKLASLAPGWTDPWEGRLNVLPLPGLLIAGEAAAADLGRIGPCGASTLEIPERLASVSLDGMRVLKSRLSSYFARTDVPDSLMAVGAHFEWHELDLWERWTSAARTPDGFQAWLSEENPNFPGRARRETIYDDLGGIREQLNGKLAE